MIVYDLKKNGNVKFVLTNSSYEIDRCVGLNDMYLACGILGQDMSSSRVNIWNLTSGQLEFSVINSSLYLSDLIESETRNYYLLTQSTIDFKIYAWNLMTKKIEFCLVGHKDLIILYEKLVNDATSMLATKSLDNTTMIWGKDRTLAFKFENGWSPNLNDLVYLPGKNLCSLENDLLADASNSDSSIKIFNVTSGQLEFTLNQSSNNGSYVFDIAKLGFNLMASLLVYYV